MSKSNIKRIYSSLPEKAGVYLFKNETGDILYVGKAINLKKRVASYFAKALTDRPWTATMIDLITEVETIVVDNELEALMLEATLIKQHLPRFNIKLTDDKSYPYIKLVTNEPVPRFTITRRQEKEPLRPFSKFRVAQSEVEGRQTQGKRANYFGPYLSGRAAEHTLEFLRKLYGIHVSPRPFKRRGRACLNCQLDGFTCPLADEISTEKYLERISPAVDFLQGKRKTLINDLRDRMNEVASRNQFELAAKLRDRLHSVEQIVERQQVISTALDDYDVIGTAKSATMANLMLLQVREGRVSGQRNFFFNMAVDEFETDVIRQFLINIYPNFTQFPQLIVVDQPIVDQEVIERFLCTMVGQAVELRTAVRGEKRQLVELANKNAQAKLETRLLSTDNSYQSLIALKNLLKLSEIPERIEAVDISNLGSSEPVGATVCFINGQPDKNEYRRYKIHTVAGQNDFAMIGEVVRRRFTDNRRPLPDIFMIDGGPEQLKSALNGLEEAGYTSAHGTTPNIKLEERSLRVAKPIKTFFIGLAKKPDRVFLPGRKLPWPSSRGHKGILLLARIRDEVHRFAIGFQRNRQLKKSLSSDLDRY